MGWIVSLVTSLLGLLLKHKQDVSEQAGETKQALKDQEAANAVTTEAVAAASAGDQRRVMSEDTPADTSKPDPDLPYRD